MQMSLFTYDGNAINDTTNFIAWFEIGQSLAPESSPVYTPRYATHPYLSGGVLNQTILVIRISCRGTIHSQRQTIKQWFDTTAQTPKTLIAKDLADSNRQWFVKAIPTRVVEEEIGVLTIALALAEPYWRVVVDSTDSWAVTGTGSTNVVSVLGNAVARPVITMTPTGSRTGYYQYSRWVPCRNPNIIAMPNEPFDCTFGGLATSTLVGAGKMLSSGNDLRVYVDGLEVSRWLKGMNTATTLVWITLDFQHRCQPTLLGSHTAGVTTLTFKQTQANLVYLRRLSKARNQVLYVGTEAITFTDIDEVEFTATGCVRGTRGTTAASHADGDICYWMQHDVWIVYGHPGAGAPDTLDTFKPMFDVTQSTNTLRVYTDYTVFSVDPFEEDESARPAQWSPKRLRSLNPGSRDNVEDSDWYSANHDTHTQTNYAEEMGMRIAAFQIGNVWKAETAAIEWRIYHPGGFTSTNVTGEKFRITASPSWPAFAGLQKSNDGINWVNVYNEAAPTAGAWASITNTGAQTLSGTFKYLRFFLRGNVSPLANNKCALEIDAVQLTMDSNKVIQGSMGAEQNAYHFKPRITNNTTGQWISFDFSGLLNKAVVLNCDLKTFKNWDGTPIPVKTSTIRSDWLNMIPGSNTLQWDDSGTGNITISLTWEDRATL